MKVYCYCGKENCKYRKMQGELVSKVLHFIEHSLFFSYEIDNFLKAPYRFFNNHINILIFILAIYKQILYFLFQKLKFVQIQFI